MFPPVSKEKKLFDFLFAYLYDKVPLKFVYLLKVGSCCFKCIVIFVNLFFKLSVRTFNKEISKSLQKVQS